MASVLPGGLDGLFQVPHIVQRVENADDVDAVFNGLAAEGVHHVIGIVLVAQNVLATEQHLQLRVLHVLADGPQPLPRILVQETHTGVEGGAAPALQRVVADGIQHFQRGEHILRGHTGGRLRLVSVPEDGICNEPGLVR